MITNILWAEYTILHPVSCSMPLWLAMNMLPVFSASRLVFFVSYSNSLSCEDEKALPALFTLTSPRLPSCSLVNTLLLHISTIQSVIIHSPLLSWFDNSLSCLCLGTPFLYYRIVLFYRILVSGILVIRFFPMVYSQYTSACVDFMVKKCSLFYCEGNKNNFICSLCPSVISPKYFSETLLSVIFFSLKYSKWLLFPESHLLAHLLCYSKSKLNVKCYISQEIF